MAPHDWPLVKENLRRRIAGEIPSVHYDFDGQRKDGAVIRVDVFGSRTIYGGRPAVIGTLLDITKQTKMQSQLKQHAEELERLNKLMIGRELKKW